MIINGYDRHVTLALSDASNVLEWGDDYNDDVCRRLDVRIVGDDKHKHCCYFV